MTNSRKRVNIIMLMSMPTSGALLQWQETILQSTAEFSHSAIIIAPYSAEECKIAIDLFKRNGKLLQFVSITETTFSSLQTRVSELIQLYFSAFDIRKIITCFNPIINDREILLNTISAGVEKYTKNNDDEIVNDTNNIIKSSLLLKEFAYQLSKNALQHLQYHHLMYDPAEVHLDELLDHITPTPYTITHFIHNIPSISNVYVNPFIVYSFSDTLLKLRSKKSSQLNSIKLTKSFKFVFGLTAFTEDRKQLVHKINNSALSKNTKNKFYYYYVNDEGKKIDTRVDYNEYLRQLTCAKTTLVIPSYKDDITFSVHRFVESIAQCCIPVVYQANYKAAFESDVEMSEIIKQHLFIDDISKLNAKLNYINKNYVTILRLLLNSNYIYKLSSHQNFKQYTQIMLNID